MEQMQHFIGQLEGLKLTFAQLAEDQRQHALDRMEECLEEMGQETVFGVQNDQTEFLMHRGESEVNDYLEGFPSTSGAANFNFNFNFTTDFPQETPKFKLYCFTCGAEFNNRKALYRHGKATNHQVREPKSKRKAVRKGKKSPEEEEEEVEDSEEDSVRIDPKSPICLDEIDNLIESDDDGKKGQQINCYECKRVFENRKALYRHGKRSLHRIRLKRAKRSVGGPIECSECEYRTTTSMNLRHHLKRSHSIVMTTSDISDKRDDSDKEGLGEESK